MSIPASYPQRVRAALETLLTELEPAAPEPSALLIYGSLAWGGYREGASDVNLAVVLTDASESTLSAIRAPLRAAWRAVGVAPLLIERGEIEHLGDVFPIKLSDIQAHHHVLAGDDPFTGVTIEPTHLRLRVEQELRNHLIRMRRRYVDVGDSQREPSRTLIHSASSLRIELRALLRLAGKPVDAPDLSSVNKAAVAAFSFDEHALERLRTFKHTGKDKDVRGLYFAIIDVLAQAVACADKLEVSP